MANIGTAISGFFGGLGSSLLGAAEGLGSFVNKISPLAEIGLTTAAAVKALESPRPSAAPMQAAALPSLTSVRPTGALALPGGAPMATVSTSYPVMQASGLVPSLRGLGQSLVPGGSPGPAMCITPVPTRSGLRMPRIVQGFNPTNPNLIETYVRAPRPRYKVTVSGPRRRCRGGR